VVQSLKVRLRAALWLCGSLRLILLFAVGQFALGHGEDLAQAILKRPHLLGWRRIGIRNRLHAPIIAHLVALRTEETMNILKISLAALVGFAFGIALFHTPEVKAQQQAGNVVVFIHAVTVLDTKLPTNQVLPGSRVDGISCIPKPIAGKLPDAAVCYVATTN